MKEYPGVKEYSDFMDNIEKGLDGEKEKHIRQEAREVVQRNEGHIRRYIITLDHLILFFSILEYKQLVIDFQYLKTQLQMERVKYNKVIKK